MVVQENIIELYIYLCESTGGSTSSPSYIMLCNKLTYVLHYYSQTSTALLLVPYCATQHLCGNQLKLAHY